MKDWKILWAIIAILLIITGVFAFSLFKTRTAVIENFESCAAAGYPILEIYPEQCITPDGRSFTRNVTTGSDGIACTLEAKICSDGSTVGRTGPNCEFTLCPGE